MSNHYEHLIDLPEGYLINIAAYYNLNYEGSKYFLILDLFEKDRMFRYLEDIAYYFRLSVYDAFVKQSDSDTLIPIWKFNDLDEFYEFVSMQKMISLDGFSEVKEIPDTRNKYQDIDYFNNSIWKGAMVRYFSLD